MRLNKIILGKIQLTLLGVTHNHQPDIAKLYQLIKQNNYDQVFLELCSQRFRHITQYINTLDSIENEQIIKNEFNLALYMQKEKNYKISLIDASTSELIQHMKTVQKEDEALKGLLKRRHMSILEENCYYSTQFFFRYNLSLRIKGNLLAKFPEHFEDFYTVFVKKREETMKAKINTELRRCIELNQPQNVLLLIGKYHFEPINDFLNSRAEEINLSKK